MSNQKYVTVRLPKELVNEIDEIVGTRGYKSRAEFVKEAIRKKLDIIKHVSSLSNE